MTGQSIGDAMQEQWRNTAKDAAFGRTVAKRMQLLPAYSMAKCHIRRYDGMIEFGVGVCYLFRYCLPDN